MKLGAALVSLSAVGMVATPGHADPSGELVTGASYSSIYGATGFADILIEDAFQRNLDIDLRFRGGEEGQGARIGVSTARQLETLSFGENAELFARVRGEISQWDFESFDRTNLNFTVGVAADLSPILSYRVETFIDHVETDDLDPGASALILRDEGAATAVGLGLSFDLSNREDVDTEILFADSKANEVCRVRHVVLTISCWLSPRLAPAHARVEVERTPLRSSSLRWRIPGER